MRWFRSGACDGFTLARRLPVYDLVNAEQQRRGLYYFNHEADAFRGNLKIQLTPKRRTMARRSAG
jgi:hypothetical protein